MNRRRPIVLAALALGAMVGGVTGCSSGSAVGSGQVTAMVLRHDMADLASAAAAHNTSGAGKALVALKADVTAAHSAKVIDDATLARILAAAVRVQSDLNPSPPLPSASVTDRATPPATRPTPTKNPPANGPGDGHGKGHGKGGKGDGGGPGD